MTNETAMATTEAWRNYTLSLEPFGIISSGQIIWVPSWYELYESTFGASADENGINIMFTSRLLSRDTVATKYAEVAKILVNCSGSFKYVLHGSPIWIN